MSTIKFPKESDDFYRVLKARVASCLEGQNISNYGNQKLLRKGYALILVMLVLYALIYWITSPLQLSIVYMLIGPLSVIMAINLVHDAAHGIAHENRKVNDRLMLLMDIMGGNSYMWKRRHKVGHHAFPNVVGKDPDLSQSKIAKILPTAVKIPIHRFQNLYMPFLYALYTLNWILFRDFQDFFHPQKKFDKVPKIEYYKLFFFKLLYFTLFLVLPTVLTGFSFGQVFIAFLCLHVASSYFLTIALVPSHVSDESEFPLPDENGILPYSWSHHQVHTTIDFATDSKMWTWLLGGFNHHIVHHLFPNISHIHYELITPIAKRTIEEFNLPYQHQDSLWKAYLSHYRLIKNNALS